MTYLWLLSRSFVRAILCRVLGHLAPVVRKVDNAIHRINHYSVDSVVCFVVLFCFVRTRANLFLFGPNDPKISALTNFVWAHFPVANEATREG